MTWSAPVRYAECDQQGVVFNAHYLTYCDEAMSAYVASIGYPYALLLERGVDVQLVSTTLTWKSAARWGDLVEVDVRCDHVGRTSFRLNFVVRVGDRECCLVDTTYVAVTADGLTPTPVPDWLREVLTP